MTRVQRPDDLITQPGVLTVAYIQGRRVPYIPPFQLFLIANVLFFALQSLTNTNIVSSPMDSHLHMQDWNAIAENLVNVPDDECRMMVETNARELLKFYA